MSFALPPAELMREIAEEIRDDRGWSFVLWCRLRRLQDATGRLEEGRVQHDLRRGDAEIGANLPGQRIDDLGMARDG